LKYLVALVALSASLAPGVAVAKKGNEHCITPAGEDLNEIFGTPDAFIAPFCTEVHTGGKWRAILRIAVAGPDRLLPPGYAPSRSTLDEDFLAKFVSGRYVVDAGTKRERSYSFSSTSLTVEVGALPDETRFLRWFTPPMHPLPPGDHTVDEYVTLSADFWDGLGLDPTTNLIPAGESLAVSVQFRVVKP
jgi:hypothetical protein